MNSSTIKHEPTVRVGPFVNLGKVIQMLGHDPLPIFSAHNFEASTFSDPENRIPFLQGTRMLEGCVEFTGCDQIGLLVGQMSTPSHLGLAGLLAGAAPTVEQALVSLVENIQLHDEGGTASLAIGPEFSSIGFSIHVDGASAIDQISDLSAVIIYNVMTSLCEPNWKAISVSLQRPAPSNRKRHSRFFRTSIFYDALESKVVFSSECLSKRPPSADTLLFRHLKQEARILRELHTEDLVESLSSVLRLSLLTGKFTADEVAASYGLNERTLHRRLKKSGTTFRRELDHARRVMSEQLLENTDLAVNEIASSLGYADSSSFVRAFGRWSGASPNAWRIRNAQGR